MNVNGKPYRAVWWDDGLWCVDQSVLPDQFATRKMLTFSECLSAITSMVVRGAGTLGAFAAFTVVVGQHEGLPLRTVVDQIKATRPTAVDLFTAVDRVAASKNPLGEAEKIATEYVDCGRRIGVHANALIAEKVNVITHCNTGWMALVDFGTALSALYVAHAAGKKVHVWVDETRPRLQGTRLTAWELQAAGISHDVIVDGAAASLMAAGKVDVVLVGADRIAKNGDVANKIGTLSLAVNANHFNVPFYVAAPSSTLDVMCPFGKNIIIENRDPMEVLCFGTSSVAGPGTKAFNPAFDVTPFHLISGYITEKGVFRTCRALFDSIT
jgi:methylthioribose-1-phosphate isomerase